MIRNTRNQVKQFATTQSPYRVGDLSDVFYFQKMDVTENKQIVPKTEVIEYKPKIQKTEITENKPITKKYIDLPFAEMAFIKGGTFMMGDTRNEGDGGEKPVHQATVGDFWMGKYEVTQRQWEDIMGTNPSYFKNCIECPVESVSWNDVQDFLKKLNQKTGLNYRLPTEAEWEYAAGGGAENRTRFGNGQDILTPAEANLSGYIGKTSKVGLFSANRLGLYDLTGNVWEWCQDWYRRYTSDAHQNTTGVSMYEDRNFRVLRGGSWFNHPMGSTVINRHKLTPSYRYCAFGFRVVLSK